MNTTTLRCAYRGVSDGACTIGLHGIIRADGLDTDELFILGNFLSEQSASKAVQSLAYILKDAVPGAHAFGDPAVVFLIERLAAPAAVLLGNIRDREAAQRLNSDLAEALADRDMISRAQGVLSERMNLSAEESLAVLLTAAREENKPLHSVARETVSGMTDR